MKSHLALLLFFVCGCQTTNRLERSQELTAETAQATFISEFNPDGIKLGQALELLREKVKEGNPNLAFNYSLYRLGPDVDFPNPTVSMKFTNISLYHILVLMSEKYAWGWWLEDGTFIMNMQSITYDEGVESKESNTFRPSTQRLSRLLDPFRMAQSAGTGYPMYPTRESENHLNH